MSQEKELKEQALRAPFSSAVVSGRGCERDGVGEQRAAAGGDALAALPAPGPHLRGALRAAQGDRATVGGMVSGRESSSAASVSGPSDVLWHSTVRGGKLWEGIQRGKSHCSIRMLPLMECAPLCCTP